MVSVYRQNNDNPWDYANTVIDPLAYEAGKEEIKFLTHFNMGFGHEHNRSDLDVDDRFHEVDIIGNPTLALIDHFGFLLPSGASSFTPYYLSLADAYAWRFPLLERLYPGALIPGLHEVGTVVINDWGPIYPRNGFVAQPNDAKAAAVIAQRAADIVTKSGQPHIYNPLSSFCGEHCTLEPTKENDQNTQFQMIYPIEDNQCTVFGENDVDSLKPWGMDAFQKGHGRYAWIMWRHYHGCIQGVGDYIGSLDF